MTLMPLDSPASFPGADAPAGKPLRVLVLGATGTIGQAAVRSLTARGHDVVCLVRAGPATRTQAARLTGAELRLGDVTQPDSLQRDGLRGERFDTWLSCLASRTGEPEDAWAIDHRAHLQALQAAQASGARHWIQLSAICVQKPRLAFQHAKLAFEQALMESDLAYSIVRPTAYFKSLSGQVERVRRGKPFLVFGDGQLTRCKPISDSDLGDYLADCATLPSRRNRILPIGGPGEAITPRQQGEALFRMLGREPRFKQVPIGLLDLIIASLSAAATVVPRLKAKAELARIGRYYATESMLSWDPLTGQYDAAATPSTGHQTLIDFYADLLQGRATLERGEHAVF